MVADVHWTEAHAVSPTWTEMAHSPQAEPKLEPKSITLAPPDVSVPGLGFRV